MALPLRNHIEQPGFSFRLQDIELATEDKIIEGRQLINAGSPNGSIYLLGYAAEMILKVAYIKVSQPRARPATNVGFANKQASDVGSVLIPHIDRDGFHSILFWAMLIESVHRGRGNPLPPSFAIEFEQRTQRLHERWKVDMRYLPAYYTSKEALAFEEDVLWLRGQQTNLWS